MPLSEFYRIVPAAGRDHELAVAREADEGRIGVLAAQTDQGARSLCQISLPVAASQTRTKPSAWPVTIRSPDGDHAAAPTRPTGVLSSWCSRRPVATSKSAIAF